MAMKQVSKTETTTTTTTTEAAAAVLAATTTKTSPTNNDIPHKNEKETAKSVLVMSYKTFLAEAICDGVN